MEMGCFFTDFRTDMHMHRLTNFLYGMFHVILSVVWLGATFTKREEMVINVSSLV